MHDGGFAYELHWKSVSGSCFQKLALAHELPRFFSAHQTDPHRMPFSSRTPTEEKVLKVSYLPHQLDVFDCKARNVVYVKGRRAGGTHGAATRLIELAYLHPHSRHLWIDTTQRNIHKLMARYFLPCLKDMNCTWNARDHVLKFESGSWCDFGSAERPEMLEGFAYDYIWINEAGLVLRDEAIYYHTLLPMLIENSKTRLFCIGAPKGDGLFRRMFDWGQDNLKQEWASFQHPSHINPLLDRKQLENLQQQMPKTVYRQEIMAEFIHGVQKVFSSLEQLQLTKMEMNPTDGMSYLLGVDLARWDDFTVIWVGCIETRTAVYCERFQRIPWQSQLQRLLVLSHRFHQAPLYVDASGSGDPICEELTRLGAETYPVVFTHARKQQLVEHLALCLEQNQLKLAYHQETLRELAAYEHHRLPSGFIRTSAPHGQHDDCVMALALCLWGMSEARSEFIMETSNDKNAYAYQSF